MLHICLHLLYHLLVQHVVVTLVELINGLINLVIYCAELTSGFEGRTFAGGGCGCSGFARGEQLGLLDATTGPGQIGEAAMLLFLDLQGIELVLALIDHQVLICA